MEISSIKLLVRGLAMGFTYKGVNSPHLQTGTIGGLVDNFRALGFSDQDIEVEFRNENDGKVHNVYWYVAELDDGTRFLNWVIEEEDDGIAADEEGTTAWLNSRGW